MAFKDNLKNLSKDIQEIAYLVEKLQNNSHLSEIETDLLKHKLQLIYAEVLKLENTGYEQVSAGVNEETRPVQNEKPEPEFPEIIPLSKEEIHREKEAIPEARLPEPKSEPAHKEPLPGSGQQGRTAKIENAVLGDLFRDKQQFRNESLRNKEEIKDLSSMLQEQPIPDIVSAIGINERFMFIRELFNGDQSLYTSTIERLNSVSSEKEAREFISREFNWDLDQGAAKNLLDLTRRKLKNKDNG